MNVHHSTSSLIIMLSNLVWDYSICCYIKVLEKTKLSRRFYFMKIYVTKNYYNTKNIINCKLNKDKDFKDNIEI